MEKITGSFYFRQTETKNLIGEYTNNCLSIILTECSNYCGNNERNEEFIGQYITVWHDKNEGTQTMNLEITFKEGSNKKIFTLKWTDSKGKKVFVGLGFVVDRLLIGSYTSI